MPVTIKVKYEGTISELNLNPADCPYDRIAKAFGLSSNRIKLIRAGKVLPVAGATDLPESIRQPGTVLVLSSESLPTARERLASSALANVRSLWTSLTLEGIQEWTKWAATWLWSCLAATARGTIAFVSSAVVAPAAAGAHHD